APRWNKDLLNGALSRDCTAFVICAYDGERSWTMLRSEIGGHPPCLTAVRPRIKAMSAPTVANVAHTRKAIRNESTNVICAPASCTPSKLAWRAEIRALPAAAPPRLANTAPAT